MARVREFEEDVALERALHVFWTSGYQATSMDRLLEATGLSKSSLYQAFGSKRDLLVRCLDRFAEQIWEGPLAPLTREDAGFDAIADAFRLTIARAAAPHGQRGCFVNSCLGEVAPHDPALLRATRAILQRIEDALARAVERGQHDGHIGSAEPSRTLAIFLLNTLSGINLAAKAKPPRARLDDIARVALDCLNPRGERR